MIIVDAHEDLAWNMLTFGRDYTRSAARTRALEEGGLTPRYNQDTLLGWPDYQRGRVALVFATLFATPRRRVRQPEFDILAYDSPLQAHRLYSQQMDAYHRLVEEHPTHFRLVRTQDDLRQVLERWQENPDPWPVPSSEIEPDRPPEEERSAPEGNPVGLVPLMEGAEAIRDPGELEEWWGRGLRLIGLSWAGTRFAGGTHEPGPLTKEGYALLDGMAGLGFGLDISHMDEEAALQALDHYPGPICASHANAARLLKDVRSNRLLSDRTIHSLLERDGVIGIVPFNIFLVPGWRTGDRREAASLQHAAAQIDAICQMAGDALHVGIGSDFDGGFGLQSVPPEIDTVADLQQLAPLLAEKGYGESDIAAILGTNWIRFIQTVLPNSA
jgi:membrane dipeptidase